jgi:signal transduction histidine kinase
VIHLVVRNQEDRRELGRLRLSEEVAHRQHLEARLRVQEEEARVDRLQREFVSVVSHELRTPLTSIHGALGLIEGGVAGPMTARGRELVRIASDNTIRLRRLIDDILDLEKVESGRMDFAFERVDPCVVAERAVEGIRMLGYPRGISYGLHNHLDGERVDADPSRLEQVLANLLSNATKYAPDGDEVLLELDAEAEDVVLRVVDHGPGVPPELRGRIFDRFVQVDSSDRRAKGGTGLGLAICRALVHRHGGRISVDSAPGRTAFEVRLPIVERVEEARQA